jgi:ATP sulfurylase
MVGVGLGVEMVPMREFHYCKECEGIAKESVCPHTEGDRLTFRGTALKKKFQADRPSPKEYRGGKVT